MNIKKPVGMTGKHHTEEAKKKNSDAHKGKPSGRKDWHPTEESKRKNAESHRGKPNKYKGCLGLPRSQEIKDKISKTAIAMNRVCTDKTKKKISIANKGRIPSHLVGQGKRSHYQSPLQGEVCFRSSYELAYAKYLDSISELWMYEMETFNLGNTTYTPDFFLPRKEKFIEIKGYMRPESQLKINQFREQYPWDLEVLRLKELKELQVL